MKVAERVLDVDSTLTGENVRMGIDEAAIQHIIGVLTDLYSDPELAVIREYSTNALDAHIEAGNSAPIEVTTPTNLAPFFRVKDNGIGLDAEGIRSIYSKYGVSTKRDTDEQVGMLGLGCKSALTYSDQFTLIGTKDGRQVQVQIGRDEDGGGSMTIVSDEPSDAPNGVEVIVPAKRDNDYEAKAKSFFRFWTPGTVLLNGETPRTIAEQAEPTWLIPDKLFVFDPQKLEDRPRSSYYRDTSSPGWVVMGNVAYPIPDESNQRNRNYKIIAFVDIGEVNFTPSRESLMLTKRTKDTLARIEADVERELLNAAQKRVAEAATPADAIRFTQEAAAFGVKTDGIKYQGRDVPTELKRADAVLAVGELGPSNSWLVMGNDGYARSRKNGERYRTIPPYNRGRVVFTGYESKELSAVKREKLQVWLSANTTEQPKQAVFVDKLTADERFWLTGTPIHDWTPVQEIKLDGKGTIVGRYGATRPRGSYENGRVGDPILAEEIDTTKPVLWIWTHERYEARKREGKIPADATLVVMPQNRLDKFQRDFPTAIHWFEYVKKEATDWIKQQDPKLVEAAKYRIGGSGAALMGFDHTKVDDPELAERIRTQNDPAVRPVQQGIEQRQAFLGHDFDSYHLRQKNGANPFKNYPLLSDGYGLARIDKEHIYLYVNAAYAA